MLAGSRWPDLSRVSERELNAEARGAGKRRMEVTVVDAFDRLTRQTRPVEVVDVRHLRIKDVKPSRMILALADRR
jgi:hypothetical protein